MNDHRVRTDSNKLLPSGVSPNVAFALCHKYGGENKLQAVDVAVVWKLMVEIGGEALIQFVTPEYAAKAEAAYNSLRITSLTLENVWSVFESLLPLML
jgi:hypothetical protein